MSKNTQLIILAISIVGFFGFLIAIYVNMRKQLKRNEKEEKAIAEMKRKQSILPPKNDLPVKPAKVLNKLIIVKRPGEKVELYGSDKNIISWCMRRANKQYSEAKLIDRRYIEYRKQPGRKKAKGYWQFTIQYAE